MFACVRYRLYFCFHGVGKLFVQRFLGCYTYAMQKNTHRVCFQVFCASRLRVRGDQAPTTPENSRSGHPSVCSRHKQSFVFSSLTGSVWLEVGERRYPPTNEQIALDSSQ